MDGKIIEQLSTFTLLVCEMLYRNSGDMEEKSTMLCCFYEVCMRVMRVTQKVKTVCT
jgi:hypothetical protein